MSFSNVQNLGEGDPRSCRAGAVWLVSILLVAVLGCGAQEEAATESTSPSPPAHEASLQTSQTPTMLEILDDLAPLPTHWIAQEPVGVSSGPVSAEMLRAPFEQTDRWLHYAGTTEGHATVRSRA
jgi:hypothetical protein